MRLKAIKLKNFRGYTQDITIPVERLTALVGRNDGGKSSILDALAIFFDAQRFEPGDRSVYADPSDELAVGCVFTDFPETLVLERQGPTTLADEYLLNPQGELEIWRVQGSKTDRFHAVAMHPPGHLLSLSHAELRGLTDHLAVDHRSGVAMRQALWGLEPELSLVRIPLGDGDARLVWSALQKVLPHFALFRADGVHDDALDDPLQFVIARLLRDLSPQLDEIKEQVSATALALAERTHEVLAGLDPQLARKLEPSFTAEPRWTSLFKLSLVGADGIPFDKRGSAARRLVLFAFFKAEAERVAREGLHRHVIFAIEEPETAQHPSLQEQFAAHLLELTRNDHCQVLLTTHSPALAACLPISSLRHVGGGQVQLPSDRLLDDVVHDLGVPRVQRPPGRTLRLLICMEGPHDVILLRHLAALVVQLAPDVKNLLALDDVRCIPLGGSTLKHWSQHQYLRGFVSREVHIYDGERREQYGPACEAISCRPGCYGFLTSKRAVENYLHPAAIERELGVRVQVDDHGNVIRAIKRENGMNEGRLKERLAHKVAAIMTPAELAERDPQGEVIGWFRAMQRAHASSRDDERLVLVG